jgi:protein-disulfide isomerase
MRLKTIALALAATCAATAGYAQAQNWVATVARADTAHVIGNPQADRVLTEYISYTCPHCATFAREGEEAVKLAYIAPGKLRLEIRHLLRDPVDLTAALLAHCGAASKFPQNHSAIMLAQGTWLPKMMEASAAQRQRWTTGDMSARRRAIASDLGFYGIMERRGYSRTQADQCLNDTALANSLAKQAETDWKLPGIGGTPAFAIDGLVLTGTHSWQALQPQLDARF